MNTLRKLLKNNNTKAGGFYLIGNLFNKAIAFFMVPIFTRLMSTTDYGIVNTYMSWVSILSLIVGLSLGSSIRSAYIDFKEDLDSYVSSIFFLSLINFVITSSIIIILTYYYRERLDIVLVILCLMQSYMTFIINSMDIRYMISMDYIRKTLLLSLPNIITAILSIICLLNMEDNKYLGRIIPYVVVTSFVGTYYLIKSFYKGRKYIDFRYWKYAIKLSVPLIFHGLSINILSNSDRTMITLFRNASETGIYSLAYNFSMVASVVTTSLESVWIPWFTQKLKDNKKKEINEAAKIYIEIVLVVMIGILMIGPEVLALISPEEYWSGKILIPPVVLASFFIFLYSISVDLEYYYKSTKIIAANTFIAALVNLILNFIFIPRYGALAASYTTVVAYIISFAIHYREARKLDSELFPINIYIKPILIIIFIVISTYMLMDHGLERWLILIIGFGLYVLFSIKNQRFNKFIK
ncbi:MAG: lipopolysaccharide biosynthesis protein [Peptococcales bacterium]|jgi:O-antigen/teichoic acid export membrane protein